MRSIEVFLSAMAAGAVMACTPVPALALTEAQCNTHATFAYGLHSEDVTEEMLAAFIEKQSVEDRAYFQMIAEVVVANIDEVRAMTSREFAETILQQCTEARQKGTV